MRLTFLGTGTSFGVPQIGCSCAVCRSADPRDRRSRSAALVEAGGAAILIDTPPELRLQLIAADVSRVDAVLFTHEHADHIFGLDDLRLFPFYLGGPVPLYCEERVEERIRRSYDYAFHDEEPTHHGAVPQLVFRRIGLAPFEALGARITPVRLLHGPKFEVLGFRLGNVAYCTDVKAIPAESMALLTGLDVLVLDALRIKPHVTHLSLDESIEIARQLAPRRTIFTHISHDLGHEQTNAHLPAGMELGYDGQRVPLT
jgi:phosphoribosyl 1,2-cyclic phosphate phosphodiesterase